MFFCVIGLNEAAQIHPAAKAAVIAFDMLYEVLRLDSSGDIS